MSEEPANENLASANGGSEEEVLKGCTGSSTIFPEGDAVVDDEIKKKHSLSTTQEEKPLERLKSITNTSTVNGTSSELAMAMENIESSNDRISEEPTNESANGGSEEKVHEDCTDSTIFPEGDAVDEEIKEKHGISTTQEEKPLEGLNSITNTSKGTSSEPAMATENIENSDDASALEQVNKTEGNGHDDCSDECVKSNGNTGNGTTSCSQGEDEIPGRGSPASEKNDLKSDNMKTPEQLVRDVNPSATESSQSFFLSDSKPAVAKEDPKPKRPKRMTKVIDHSCCVATITLCIEIIKYK